MLTDLEGNPIDVDKALRRRPKPRYTLDEWNHELEIRPITSNQQGRIMDEFTRLGFHPAYDRDERISIITRLIDRDVDSTHELKQGEAGYLVNLLQQCDTTDDLYDLLPEPQHTVTSWHDIAVSLARLILAIKHPSPPL